MPTAIEWTDEAWNPWWGCTRSFMAIDTRRLMLCHRAFTRWRIGSKIEVSNVTNRPDQHGEKFVRQRIWKCVEERSNGYRTS